MRIGIDARPLSRGGAGITRAVRSLVQALAELDSKNFYFLYSNREFTLPVANARWRKIVDRAYSLWPGTLWLVARGAAWSQRDGLDVWWATAPALPRGGRNGLRKVVTVHDLVPYRCPETMSLYNRLVAWQVMAPSIHRSDVIISVSEFTKQELQRVLGISPSRVQVVREGVTEDYYPRERVAAAEHIAEKFQASTRYVCAVGTIEPRKNLTTLIDAMGVLWGRGRLLDHQLVIAGAAGWKNSHIYARVRDLGPRARAVKFLGYVLEEDLPVLYAGAAAFVFPSLYEGFGLPLLEAMACGTPIVASDSSSIPEVVGDAAVLVDPRSPEQFAEAIGRVIEDNQLRVRLIKKGLERVKGFRWETAARRLLEVFTNTEAAEAAEPAESK